MTCYKKKQLMKINEKSCNLKHTCALQNEASKIK